MNNDELQSKLAQALDTHDKRNNTRRDRARAIRLLLAVVGAVIIGGVWVVPAIIREVTADYYNHAADSAIASGNTRDATWDEIMAYNALHPGLAKLELTLVLKAFASDDLDCAKNAPIVKAALMRSDLPELIERGLLDFRGTCEGLDGDIATGVSDVAKSIDSFAAQGPRHTQVVTIQELFEASRLAKDKHNAFAFALYEDAVHRDPNDVAKLQTAMSHHKTWTWAPIFALVDSLPQSRSLAAPRVPAAATATRSQMP
jgi:hypothetical protein